jgi:hypothetical protein
MAEEPKKSGGSKGQLREDRIVEALVPDPGQHQPGFLFIGLLGKAIQPGDWRLYLTPELNEYVEFSEQDVVHSQPISQEESPLGGSRVWLRSGASFRHTCIETRQAQADFLRGGITSAFMSRTSPFVMAGVRRPPPETGYACTRNYVCSTNPHIPACQDASYYCPTNIGCTVYYAC